MIDLHTHTTASDGRCTPADLVTRAWNAGIRTLAVTDHDTMAGVFDVTAAASARGMTVVPGIEITSVHGGRDVHVLAYFLSPATPGLQEMLAEQRRLRVERAREIGERLARLGAPIDVGALVEASAGTGGRSLARPQIAQALIAAGHVSSVAEAFDRYISEDGPAYVPHRGASPTDVVDLVTRGGGLASLAHPGYTKKDDIIPELVAAGLAALEAFHSAHDAADASRYIAMAGQYGLNVTGGSDYHGPDTRRSEFFGVTHLPQEHFDALMRRASRIGHRGAAL